MNYGLWLLTGSAIGWLASSMVDSHSEGSVVLNVVAGIIGSVLGGWLVAPLIGASSFLQSEFSASAWLVAVSSALVLLTIVNMIRHRHPA